MSNSKTFEVVIHPRKSIDWEEFVATTPRNSIALDGFVLGGPRFDPQTMHINYDHHDCVVREATMSTAMQVYFALKGGLLKALRKDPSLCAYIHINDTDQDTAFAVWLLMNHRLLEGVQSLPQINRLLALNDRWDITGGAFPMNLNDCLVRQHNWVFGPYTKLRKSGALAAANEHVLRDNLSSVMLRLDKFMMGQSEEEVLDTRCEIVHSCPQYKLVNEIGGNEARYQLFCEGMDAFISRVAKRPDGRFVYSIGRRSQYIPFPVEELYDDFNRIEGLDRSSGWNGSTIVGGSSRLQGSILTWDQIREVVDRRLLGQSTVF